MGEGGSKYCCKWVIIGQPAKRHLNGVSLAGPAMMAQHRMLACFLGDPDQYY